jgi:hypothetical protein
MSLLGRNRHGHKRYSASELTAVDTQSSWHTKTTTEMLLQESVLLQKHYNMSKIDALYLISCRLSLAESGQGNSGLVVKVTKIEHVLTLDSSVIP